MQLHESLRLCLLSLESRYPHCSLEMNEAILGSQGVHTDGWTSGELLVYFQRTMPEMLQTPALLELDQQTSAIYLLDRSSSDPAIRVHRPTNRHPIFEEEELIITQV